MIQVNTTRGFFISLMVQLKQYYEGIGIVTNLEKTTSMVIQEQWLNSPLTVFLVILEETFRQYDFLVPVTLLLIFPLNCSKTLK